jgi:hypothetical protein
MIVNPPEQPEAVTVWLVFGDGGLRIEFDKPCDHENFYTGDGKLICWKCGLESELAS